MSIVEEDLAQLASHNYGAELRAAGAAPVLAYAVAFDGKDVRVRAAPERRRTVRKKKPAGPAKKPPRGAKKPAARPPRKR